MEYIIICLAALIGSGLTLFSGFGLGTLLVPVFGLFFPIEFAISITAIVHFLNNIFKLLLLGNKADKSVIIRFGIPSLIAAFIGAYTLGQLSDMQSLWEYQLAGKQFSVMPVKLIIAILMLFFALMELIPSLANLSFDKKYLSLGGTLSGFFGGLSGNQGALRSAFLIRLHLPKETFIASGIVVACMVDVSRLSLYSQQLFNSSIPINYSLLVAATLSAFSGAYFGNRLLKKTTLKEVQFIVACMLVLFAFLLGLGII